MRSDHSMCLNDGECASCIKTDYLCESNFVLAALSGKKVKNTHHKGIVFSDSL